MKALGRIAAGLVVCALLLCAGRADACSVPVFRYALERWPAAPYELYVFHRGPLGGDDKKIVDWLDTCAGGVDVVSNIEPLIVDLDDNVDAATLKLWTQETHPRLPWMVLRYPMFHQVPGPVWSGPLTAANAKAVVDSPARREIGKRILAGHTAVWVLLESGDPKKDDAAARLIDAELLKMKATLKVSDLLPEDVMDGMEDDAPDVEVDFSLLRVSRKDENEQRLVGMLLGSEPGLKGASEPILFPVFGQGRALCALVGKGINRENLQDIGQFLVGPCSCIVKDENPGMDLLMSVDWAALPEGRWVRPPEMPPLMGIPNVSPTSPRESGEPVTWRWLSWGEHGSLVRGVLAVGVLVLVAVLVATALIRRRRRSEET